MKRLARVGAFALAVSMVLCIAPQPAAATVLEKMSVPQLTSVADRVLVVRVNDSTARWLTNPKTQRKETIQTVTECTVLEVLKGRARPGDKIRIRVAGGKVGKVTLVVDGLAHFRPGERCAVFLDKQNRVLGGFQGKIGLPSRRGICADQHPVAEG